MGSGIYHPVDLRSRAGVQELLVRRGWAGYGIFLGLLEVLTRTAGNRLAFPASPALLYELRVSESEIAGVLEDCIEAGILGCDGAFFWSAEVEAEVAREARLREARRVAGRRGNAVRWGAVVVSRATATEATVEAQLPEKIANGSQCDRNAIAPISEWFSSETIPNLAVGVVETKKFAVIAKRSQSDVKGGITFKERTRACTRAINSSSISDNSCTLVSSNIYKNTHNETPRIKRQKSMKINNPQTPKNGIPGTCAGGVGVVFCDQGGGSLRIEELVDEYVAGLGDTVRNPAAYKASLLRKCAIEKSTLDDIRQAVLKKRRKLDVETKLGQALENILAEQRRQKQRLDEAKLRQQEEIDRLNSLPHDELEDLEREAERQIRSFGIDPKAGNWPRVKRAHMLEIFRSRIEQKA